MGIETTGDSKISESNALIPAERKSELIGAASVLEDVPSQEKDWRPGSNGQVPDLVCPSLYCFRIGKSLIKDRGTGSVRAHCWQVPRAPQRPWGRVHISHIQLVPSPVDRHPLPCVKEGDVRPLGYANSMHPKTHVALHHGVVDSFVGTGPDQCLNQEPRRWYGHIEMPSPDYKAYSEADKTYEWLVGNSHDPT
ncbi:hypothetical protein OBBRIDRAFT_190819 [Obba rivulosa]|uniref:DUF4246 domain-containing protein n=1 Tax=Obba rivulosa TaxID=1052685 RepID=A0A8E2ALP4_9APHY|nr:hypothetical protein OBBRIDRAFT_190819 [Obba rivulosa]